MSIIRNFGVLARVLDSSGNLAYNTSAAISAAGTTQGTGTAVTADNNVITTAAASSGVVLPTSTIVGRRVIVVNKGANAVNVYPVSGSSIDALGANIAISIPVNGWMEFTASSTTQWYSTYNITTAGGGGGSFTSTDNTTTNATYYPLAATSAGGSSAVTSSTKLTFNPSTGTLGATIFNSLSDITKKTDIVIINDATNIINKIDGVEFNWVDNNNKSAGVVAQQLEEILPHLVDTNEDGLKSVNYNGIIGYLIQAVKELSAKVNTLENK